MTDFDFLVGKWRVKNRRLRERLAGCTDWEEFEAASTAWRLLDGSGNVDEFSFPDGTSALTLRVFDHARKQWSLHWATSTEGTLLPPVMGTFTAGVGTFYGDDLHHRTPVRVRYVWSDITPSSARWEQAYSADQGRSWEINWVMELSRA